MSTEAPKSNENWQVVPSATLNALAQKVGCTPVQIIMAMSMDGAVLKSPDIASDEDAAMLKRLIGEKR